MTRIGNIKAGRDTRLLIAGLAVLAIGFVIGRWTSSGAWGRHEHASSQGAASGADAREEIWTCSMHPQIRMPQPGTCPICGMTLVRANDTGSGESAVTLADSAQRVASIEVRAIERMALEHELRTVGRVEYSEPNMANLAARVAGRVERLYADYTGVEVAKGDHLVDIYSPDLVVAQEEFLLSRRALGGASGQSADERDRARSDLSRQKLLLLGVTAEQIAELEKTGRPQLILTVHAPIGGTVVEKSVREGAYVEVGEPLYSIVDLSRVWIVAEVYEFEVPWIARGQQADVTVEALAGEKFAGTVAFIDPRVDDATRTIKVRINLENSRRLLKPGMFADVRIRALLGPDGKRAPSPIAGKYVCPMHPEVVADAVGECPICGMKLVREPGDAAPAGAGLLAVPASAVLDSGMRRIVWVERAPGKYETVEVELGPRAGDRYPVLAGLSAGDRVVVHGNFLLDSQAQIEGKPSLLFPKGITAGGARPAHTGHAGH